jgi:hypothetical protein
MKVVKKLTKVCFLDRRYKNRRRTQGNDKGIFWTKGIKTDEGSQEDDEGIFWTESIKIDEGSQGNDEGIYATNLSDGQSLKCQLEVTAEG